MELKEPKKKKRVKIVSKPPLPLIYDNNGDLTIFTGHLGALGVCISDPSEMELIHSMGFFGKGSLSRSYPCFGKIRYGAPPVVRERQWRRRQKWFEEVQSLSREPIFNDEKCPEFETTQPQESTKNNQNHNKITNNTHKDKELKIMNVDEHLESKKVTCEPEVVAIESPKHVRQEIEIIIDEEKNFPDNTHSNIENESNIEVIDDEDVCEILNDSEMEYHPESNNSKYGIGETANEFIKEKEDLLGKVLVLPDSDSETEDYLRNIKPRIENESFPVRETLQLTFEESFFLTFGIGCLRIIDIDDKVFSNVEIWNHFQKEQKHFVQKYIVYHYFRSKGWVVKPGLKYGGDYLLYKEGPPFYHASYIVIIDVVDSISLKRIETKCMRSMKWNKLFAANRLAETAAKEILLAQILWPDLVPIDKDLTSPDVLSQFTVREILWRRWKVKKGMACAEDDEDDNVTDSS